VAGEQDSVAGRILDGQAMDFSPQRHEGCEEVQRLVKPQMDRDLHGWELNMGIVVYILHASQFVRRDCDEKET
jgi:hypothetical protein